MLIEFEFSLNLLLANLAVLAAVFVQTSAGIGFAMIAVPLLALLDLAYVPAPSLVILFALASIMCLHERSAIDWQGLPSLMPGLLLGTFLAAWVLSWIDPSAFGIVFGIILLLAVLIAGLGRMPKITARLLFSGGAVSGFMGTLSGIHGPPLAVLYQGASPGTARATIAIIFILAASFSWLTFLFQGIAGSAEFLTGLTLLPGLFVGYPLARIGRGKLNVKWLRLGMLLLVAISAGLLIAKSINGLLA